MPNINPPDGNKTRRPSRVRQRTGRLTAIPEPKVRLKSSVDAMFLILILLLLCIGTIMVCSASYAYAKNEFNGDSFHYVREQAKFVILGLIILALVSHVDYIIVHRFQKLIFWGSLVLMVLVLVPGIGVKSHGATRWIRLPGIQVQPSEILKVALIMYFADYNVKHRTRDNWYAARIYRWYYSTCRKSRIKFFRNITPCQNRMKTFWNGIFPYMLFLVVVAVLLYFQPHMSCLIIIGIETVVMMLLGQCSFKWMGAGAVAGGAGMMTLLMVSEHSRERLKTWSTPLLEQSMEEIRENAWQPYQSVLAIGSGGLWGVGLGNSRQKHLFLPEPQNDYIFSILCEEMGFVFACFVLLLFAVFIWRGFRIGFRAPDKYSKMVVIGIVSKIAVQVVLNIAVVSNVLPSTGVPLPFFSYGGTALLVLMAEMGMVLNISKYSYIEK